MARHYYDITFIKCDGVHGRMNFTDREKALREYGKIDDDLDVIFCVCHEYSSEKEFGPGAGKIVAHAYYPSRLPDDN